MKLLLDTCVALWFFEESPEMPRGLLAKLKSPAHQVYFSQVSTLEIQIKYTLGKLKLPDPPDVFVPETLQRHRLRKLPLTDACIFQLSKLPLLHRDPFDRLLIATAQTEGMTLVTPDRNIQAYPVKTLA